MVFWTVLVNLGFIDLRACNINMKTLGTLVEFISIIIE